MPYPCPKNIEAIVTLYQKYIKGSDEKEVENKNTNNSYLPSSSSIFKVVSTLSNYAMEKAKNFIPYYDKVSRCPEEIYILDKDKNPQSPDDICNEILRSIPTAKSTPKDWINFVYRLGDKGQKAQKWKQYDEQSHCCEMCHAIMDNILTEMTSKDDECKKEYDETVKQLINDIIEWKKSVGTSLKTNMGKGANDTEEEIKVAILKLAYLRYEGMVPVYDDNNKPIASRYVDFVHKAKKRHLFDYLLDVPTREKQFQSEKGKHTSYCHQSYKEVRPYCMQPNFWVIYFEDNFRTCISRGPGDFDQENKKKYAEEQLLNQSKSSITNFTFINNTGNNTSNPSTPTQNTSNPSTPNQDSKVAPTK